jgi:hypothetical protein
MKITKHSNAIVAVGNTDLKKRQKIMKIYVNNKPD